MKTNSKLLKLGRETLRSLTSAEARLIRGGDSLQVNLYPVGVIKEYEIDKLGTGTLSASVSRTGSIPYSG